MIIYGLVPDGENKKIFVHVEDNLTMLRRAKETGTPPERPFDSRGDKKVNDWNPPPIRWFDDDGRRLDRYPDPDITYIQPGSFIIGPKAKKTFESSLKDVAEILPIPFNDETWYFLNVFNQINAIDKNNSRYKIYENGEVGYLLKPAFSPDKVPHAKLFKIPEDPARIYYAEHYPDDNPNTFKNILKQNKLFGIQLKISQEY